MSPFLCLLLAGASINLILVSRVSGTSSEEKSTLPDAPITATGNEHESLEANIREKIASDDDLILDVLNFVKPLLVANDEEENNSYEENNAQSEDEEMEKRAVAKRFRRARNNWVRSGKRYDSPLVYEQLEQILLNDNLHNNEKRGGNAKYVRIGRGRHGVKFVRIGRSPIDTDSEENSELQSALNKAEKRSRSSPKYVRIGRSFNGFDSNNVSSGSSLEMDMPSAAKRSRGPEVRVRAAPKFVRIGRRR